MPETGLFWGLVPLGIQKVLIFTVYNPHKSVGMLSSSYRFLVHSSSLILRTNLNFES